MKVFSEKEFLREYIKKGNKYKRLNLVFSNSTDGFIFRNLVSTRLESEKLPSYYSIVYKK